MTKRSGLFGGGYGMVLHPNCGGSYINLYLYNCMCACTHAARTLLHQSVMATLGSSLSSSSSKVSFQRAPCPGSSTKTSQQDHHSQCPGNSLPVLPQNLALPLVLGAASMLPSTQLAGKSTKYQGTTRGRALSKPLCNRGKDILCQRKKRYLPASLHHTFIEILQSIPDLTEIFAEIPHAILFSLAAEPLPPFPTPLTPRHGAELENKARGETPRCAWTQPFLQPLRSLFPLGERGPRRHRAPKTCTTSPPETCECVMLYAKGTLQM